MKLTRLIILWFIFLASAFVMSMQIMNLYHAKSENDWIQILNSGHDVSVDKIINAASEVRLARAMYYARQQRYDEALATLSLIMDKGDVKLKTIIRYNLGNIYLQQAMEKLDAQNINAAQPLITLAKQAYRQALALNSHFWDAKYNLDVAMRLLPEMDRLTMQDNEDAQTPPPQLWTTLSSFPRGLP